MQGQALRSSALRYTLNCVRGDQLHFDKTARSAVDPATNRRSEWAVLWYPKAVKVSFESKTVRQRPAILD
jgi:hypothetical protein